MSYTQEQFEKLSRSDKELAKFCLNQQWQVAVRSKIEWWSNLERDILAQYEVWNISIWDTLEQWESFTEVIEKILLWTFYPTYTNPTFSLTSNQSNWQEIGTIVNVVLTYNFSRWSINWELVWWIWNTGISQWPRAWEVIEYIINWENKWTTNNHTISWYELQATQTFAWSVEFSEWQQPLDSKWEDYQTPYPANTETRNTTITALYPMYWWHSDADDYLGWADLTDVESALTIKRLQAKSNQAITDTFSWARNVFIYPASYGNLTSIIDWNWFETISNYDVFTKDITTRDWNNTSYKIYQLKNNTSQSAFTNTYKF